MNNSNYLELDLLPFDFLNTIFETLTDMYKKTNKQKYIVPINYCKNELKKYDFINESSYNKEFREYVLNLSNNSMKHFENINNITTLQDKIKCQLNLKNKEIDIGYVKTLSMEWYNTIEECKQIRTEMITSINSLVESNSYSYVTYCKYFNTLVYINDYCVNNTFGYVDLPIHEHHVIVSEESEVYHVIQLIFLIKITIYNYINEYIEINNLEMVFDKKINNKALINQFKEEFISRYKVKGYAHVLIIQNFINNRMLDECEYILKDIEQLFTTLLNKLST